MSTTTPTAAQIETLLNFLEEHRALARGLLRNVEGRAISQRLWENICVTLNAMGGCTKTIKQWQKVWTDKKYLAKKAAAAARASASATGGGPSSAPQLSQWELRVMSIMGDGFGEPQTTARVPAFIQQESTTQEMQGVSLPPQQDDSFLLSDQLPAENRQPTEPPEPTEPHIQPSTSSQAPTQQNPAQDFNKHRIVQPKIHHGRTRRSISSTRDTNGAHHSDISMTVDVEGQDYVLDLRLNEDLVAGDHVLKYQDGGKTVLHKPRKEDIDLCHYHGSVRDMPGSWVAVSTCHGIRGVIYDGKNMRYIEPAEGGGVQSNHYLYDHNDLNTSYRCGYEGGVTNNTQYDPELHSRYQAQQDMKKTRASRYKRNTDVTQVRGPYNANKQSRYVELVLVADHQEYIANGDNVNTVHAQMIQVANIINSVYSPLNIFIALVGVVVWNEKDEIQLEENGDTTLTNFLHYRERLVVDIPNDNAQLLTRQKFSDGVVGKALKGPICTFKFSGGVSTNHSEVIGLVATTIAHEMGHNFGMEHDTEEDCSCPDQKCIMSPSSTSVVPVHWSSCSLKSLVVSFERGMDYCLRNKPKRLADSPTCGNGFVEAGEQCDCGISGGEACRACCHHDTCMLRSNATCAAGMCCDLTTCRPKSAGTVCRSADQECDLPEYCTGHSEFCPDDVFKMDTTPCGTGNNQAYCAHGSCRSHTDQCRILWGATGESSHDKCYMNTNTKGDKNGNCGYDPIGQVYKPCRQSDAMCGLLQCRHLNERLEFGMESVAFLSAIFINNNGTIIPCRTAIIDLGLSDVDPGLVPDGAKCGHEKMCLNQRCIAIEALRETIANAESSVCPSNCSGHGICNSKGHCHCEPGFAPPLCALPGPGGSSDSGPASDPSVQRNFMIAMYIIFLGIIPLILLIMFLFYYSRRNVILWWKRPKKTAPSPKKASLQHRISRSASKFAANFQNNSQNSQPVNVHTLSNPDDMSSSLLRSDSDRSPAGNINPSVNFFGNFKGFSLTPIDKNQPQEEVKKTEQKSAKITPVHRSSSNSQSILSQGVLKPVMRSAPPLPVVPVTKNSPSSSPSVKRTNSSVQNRIKALISTTEKDEIPVPSTAPRPVISSPILEASTCTAKELISPLQGSKTLGPIRAAPIPPASPELPKRPLSMHSGVPQKPLPEEPKKVKEGISLNRIASFLKHDKPKEKERNPVARSHSLPKNPNHQVKVAKTADKVALRNLQISNPILQKEIDLPVNTVSVVSDSEEGDDPKAFVNRAQSMRAPIAQKPTIQSFGSMRQAPGVPRPVSIVGRPTAPPPPLPNNTDSKDIDKPDRTDYVDCIEEKQAPLSHIDEESSDNIYAIIEESPLKSKPLPAVPTVAKTIPQQPPEGYNTPKPITSNSGSTDSMGLLGEIVNEIQNRNFDSIYSASTLSRKKKNKDKNEDRDSTYMNSEHYRTPESVYSNSGSKSNASTTSSGYLHPSAVNVPTYMKKDESDTKNDNEKPPSSPTLKGPNSKIPTFSRQVTPPGLKTTTFKAVPQSPKNVVKNANLTTKNISNSPDLVSSCTLPDTKNVKAPDVINNNKLPSETPKVGTKPVVTVKPNDNRPPLRTAPTIDKKPIKNTPSIKPLNSSTNLNNKEKNPSLLRANSKVDSNVKAIADNLNKNKPKLGTKPAITNKPEATVKPTTKLTAKPSNVASLQQKFENRKSLGKEITIAKK